MLVVGSVDAVLLAGGRDVDVVGESVPLSLTITTGSSYSGAFECGSSAGSEEPPPPLLLRWDSLGSSSVASSSL